MPIQGQGERRNSTLNPLKRDMFQYSAIQHHSKRLPRQEIRHLQTETSRMPGLIHLIDGTS